MEHTPQFVTVARTLRYDLPDGEQVVEQGRYRVTVARAGYGESLEPQLWILRRDAQDEGHHIPIASVETFVKMGALIPET